MKKIVCGILCIVLLILISICIIFKVSQNNLKSEDEKKAREARLVIYSATLHIEGDFEIEGHKVIIKNKSFDEKTLIKWVALHNAFYKDTPITIEELMTAFDMFCDGMKESELIETYRNRMHVIRVRGENVEIFVHDYDYDRVIIDYLKEKFGARLSGATVEQMKEACPYAAEEIYNEVIRLETIKE